MHSLCNLKYECDIFSDFTDYIMYSHAEGISALQLPVRIGNESYLPLTRSKKVVSMDFDSRNKVLFFVEEAGRGNVRNKLSRSMTVLKLKTI